VKFDGRDCIFIWDPINPIGENVHFKDYYVQVYSSAYSFTQAANGTGFVYESYVTDPRFDLTYDLNKKIFGTVQAQFLFQVKGRSIYNTYSPTWAQLTAASEEPEDVSVINESQRAQEVFFYWDRNPNDEQYRVQIYNSAYTPTMALAGTGYVYEEYVSVPNFTVTISDLVNWFGAVQKRFGIQVKSVNPYNVESNNWKFHSFEADAPTAVGTISHYEKPTEVTFTWGKSDFDKKYHLQLYTSAYSATVASGESYTLDTYVDLPNYTITREDNENLFGSLQNKFNIQVKRVNYFEKESDNWRWYEYENRPPATPTNLSTYPGFRSVYFTWSKCTAADFEKYIIRTREGTGSYGSWEDTITNAYLAELSSTAQAGTRIGIEVKAVDNLGKQSGSLTGSAETITVKTGDAQAFNIIPSDSEGRSVGYLRVLYDTVLSGSAVNISVGDWIQYEYPVEYVYNASTIWVNKDFGLYLGYYDNNEKVWKYLAGDSSHGLSGGKLVEYSTEASAQANYYQTNKDVNGKVSLLWPFSRQSNKVRLYNYNTGDVDIYEWKNNVFVLADEIIAGELQLSKGITIAQSATADYGAIFDKDKLEFFNNGLSTVKIEKTGRARFGATGQPNISIEPSGSVVIDQEIIAEKVTSDLISSRIAELGNNHVRIDENGIFVTDANANLPKSGDTRVFIDAINRRVSFDKRVDPILVGTAQDIWTGTTALIPKIGKLNDGNTLFIWAITSPDYHPYQKPIFFRAFNNVEKSNPSALTGATASELKAVTKLSYDLVTGITGDTAIIVAEEGESSVPENLIGFFESDPGSDFVIQDGNGEEYNLTNNVFVKGSSSPNLTVRGSETHTHSYSGDSGTVPASLSYIYTGSDVYGVYDDHAHSIDHTHSAVNHLPPYRNLIPYRCLAKKLKEGIILFYYGDSAPEGWEVFTDLQDKLVRCSSSGTGTGGASLHSHPSESFTSGPSTRSTPYKGGASTSASKTHTHSFDHGHDTANNIPLSKKLLPIKAKFQARLVYGIIGFFRGSSIPDGWVLCDGNNGTPNLINYYVYCSNSDIGGAIGSNSHTHNYSGNSSDGVGVIYYDGGGSSLKYRKSVSHYHSVNHSHTDNNEPPYVELLICMYVGSGTSDPRAYKIKVSRIFDPISSPSFFTTTITAFNELTDTTYTKYPIIRAESFSSTASVFTWLDNRELYLKRISNLTASGLGNFESTVTVVTGDNIGGYDITPLDNNKVFVAWYDRDEKKVWGRYVNSFGGVGTAVSFDTLTEHVNYSIAVEALSATAAALVYSLGPSTGKGRLKYINNTNGTPTVENTVDIFTLPVPEGLNFVGIGKRVGDEVVVCISDDSSEKNIYFQKILDLSTTGQKGEIMYVTGGDELGDFLIWSEATAIAAYGMDNGDIQFVNFYNLDATAEWEVKGTIEIV